MPSDAFSKGWEPTANSYMVIKAPGMETLKVPLSSKHAVIDGVSVWEVVVLHLMKETKRLSGFQLSWKAESPTSQTRAVDPSYALGYETMFSDGYPFLLVSQGSLDALNEILEEPLLINRFRPNIVVDGCNPFSEDLWKVIKINKLTFHGVKLCARCKVPTISQEDAIAGPEPTETLMKFRSDEILRPNSKKQGKVFFGQNLVCKESLSAAGGGALVKVGDPVYILQEVSSCAEAPA
ncbi:Uncharacterized protein YcbX [Ananas comosus]|uniref:Uncharacterized protein YcbX n=1 Tax=Ananas comosus TaxID=4615 RepID=A0A199W8S4_ANACO|nr:Uncharacterized protein YcbX [Ananas comosus]